MEPEKTRTIIALAVILGFYGLIAAYFAFPLKGDAATFNLLAGAAIAATSGVLGYYFGSSTGSKAKDDALVAKATEPTPPPSAAQP